LTGAVTCKEKCERGAPAATRAGNFKKADLAIYCPTVLLSQELEALIQDMNIVDLDLLDKWLSIAEKITVLLAAFVAAIKLKVFGQWKEDYRTEIEFNCLQTKGLVWADYTVANIGDRPFVVWCVRLDLCRAKEGVGGHLVPDMEKVLIPSTFSASSEQLASKIGGFDPTKDHFKELGTLGYLGKGERTIFALRCHTKEPLPEVFFVVGQSWRKSQFSKRYKHSFFNHMHVQMDELARSETGSGG